MMDVDEAGWGHIHHATKKGYFRSVEKFIKTMDAQLEFETQDGLSETPLLVAAHVGMTVVETVQVLMSLGANMKAINTRNHGIIEICCLEGHTDLIDFLIKEDHQDVPVWKNILKFCSSLEADEAESAAKSLSELTKPGEDGQISPYWKNVFEHNAIPILTKVIKSDIADRVKAPALQCIINILTEIDVKDQLVSIGGIDTLIRHLKSPTGLVIQLVSNTFAILCTVAKYADQTASSGAIPALVQVMLNQSDPKKAHEPQVMVQVVSAVGVICDMSEPRQTMLHSTTGGIQSLCALVPEAYDSDLILALNYSITKVCRRHEVIQKAVVDSGIVPNIIALCNLKNRQIQLSAVDTIHMVVEGNSYTQKVMMLEGAINPLMMLLRLSKNQVVQEKTASSLWALAGSDGEDRRAMASRMQVKQLVDFIGSLSETLKYIGSEGLGVLAQGAQNRQDEIAEANGVHPVVRLLKEEKEYLVLSAIRTIRHLCLSVGYIAHRENQNTVLQGRGLRYLVALMTLSKSELIQVESALTLASVALNNSEVSAEMWSPSQSLQFSYVRVLKLLYSTDDIVRLLAGSALATFAYNNTTQQQAIAAEGGVRFSCFLDFLRSDDEFFRCDTAFQVIVLSKVIPDEEQAVVSSAGIKLLADILTQSRSPVIQALAADCVARLAHTRAGVPAAFVAINCVNRLCDLMISDHPQVRGSTAIALAFLSYNHGAERQLLNRCRLDPYLMKCLLYYAEKNRISPQFLNEWKHYKRIGLPPVSEGRPVLVSQDLYQRASQTGVKPTDTSKNGETKSNLARSVSSTSLNKSHVEEAEPTPSRLSRSEMQSKFSDHSRSQSVTVE